MEIRKKIFWPLIAFTVLAAMAAAIFVPHGTSNEFEGANNTSTSGDGQLVTAPIVAVTTSSTMLKSEVPVEIPETPIVSWNINPVCGYPPQVQVSLTNLIGENTTFGVEVGGNTIRGFLGPNKTRSFQVPLNSNIESGRINFNVSITANDRIVIKNMKTECSFSSSSGSAKKLVSGTPTITPTPIAPPMENMPLMAFDVSNVTGKKGEIVKVAVKISNRLKTDSIYAVILDLSYNKTVLSLTDIEKGSLASGWNLLFNAQNDRISFAYGGNGTEIFPETSGEIAKFNFMLKGDSGSQSAVNISSMQIGNADGDIEEVIGKNGTVTVVMQ